MRNCGYRISVSCDGENRTQCADGYIRIYGAEVIAAFNAVTARYIRFEVTSTAGADAGYEMYAHEPVTMNEITVFA